MQTFTVLPLIMTCFRTELRFGASALPPKADIRVNFS
jgi:hypothetical protein